MAYAIALVCASISIAPAVARAQGPTGSIKGTVVTSAGLPVDGAQLSVSLAPTSATPEMPTRQYRSESNERGEYQISVPAGSQLLRVRRLGFRPDSLTVTVTPGRTTDVHVTLVPVVVSLAAVTVHGQHESNGPMSGFYRRKSTGSGRFFTREDIEKRNPANMTDMLRNVPGIAVSAQRTALSSVRIRGSRCAPVVFLDGQELGAAEFDIDSFDPRTFDGVEVYSGAASVPVEFQRNSRISASCGTILLWSRRGSAGPRKPKAASISPSSLIARMLENRIVFMPTDVDSVARLDSSRLVVPLYPSSLFESGVSGRVLAEFVVGSDGDVDMATFSAVTTTHRAFVDAVRSALDEQRFIAARKNGTPVHQVMLLPFNFQPDSTTSRRRN